MSTTVNPYSGLGVATLETAATAKKQALGQEQFLKLMTTQLTHQDPTKPMQNGEFLSQMAQFGTVSGIQDLQQAFKDFSSSISSGQSLQAAGLVGRTVLAPATEGRLEAGGSIEGKFELPATTNSIKVKIVDAATGDVVRNISLGGTHAPGTVPFEWDGMNDNKNYAAPGVYKVQVEAAIDGVNTALETDIKSLVESVSLNGANGIQVNLKGMGSVNYNQIKQII